MHYFYSISVSLGLSDSQRLFILACAVHSIGSRYMPALRCCQTDDLSVEIGR